MVSCRARERPGSVKLSPLDIRAQANEDAKRLELLRELVALYRRHTARLARLRETSQDDDHIRYVNALCVRAHTFLYAPARLGEGAEPGWMSRARTALRRTWHAQILAWMLLVIGVLV